jgi:hypothetical protein
MTYFESYFVGPNLPLFLGFPLQDLKQRQGFLTYDKEAQRHVAFIMVVNPMY